MEEKSNVITESSESQTTTAEVESTNTDTGLIDKGVESTSTTTDEDVEVEFEDTDTADESESTKQITSKQTREQNRLYAQRRRESQRQKLLNDEYNRGRRETLKTNPYTQEEIKDDEDLANYDIMKAMDDAGYDPTSTSDFIKYNKEQKAKAEQERLANEQKALAEQKSQRARQDSETKEFVSKYPNVNLNEMLKDRDMFDTIQAYINSGKTLVQAYEQYNRLTNKNVMNKANEIATKQVQVASAKSPSMQDGESTTDVPSWHNLDPQSKEFKALLEKAKRGF